MGLPAILEEVIVGVEDIGATSSKGVDGEIHRQWEIRIEVEFMDKSHGWMRHSHRQHSGYGEWDSLMPWMMGITWWEAGNR